MTTTITRRQAITALGAAVLVPVIPGLTKALPPAEPVPSFAGIASGNLLIEIGCADNNPWFRCFPANGRMTDPEHEQTRLFENTDDPVDHNVLQPDRFGWAVRREANNEVGCANVGEAGDPQNLCLTFKGLKIEETLGQSWDVAVKTVWCDGKKYSVRWAGRTESRPTRNIDEKTDIFLIVSRFEVLEVLPVLNVN